MKIRKRVTAFALASGLVLAPAFSQATLLGLTPAEPTLDFGAGGIVDFNALTGLVTISGVPATLFQSDPFIFGEVLGTGVDDERLITVQFNVNSAGGLVSGIAGPDLVIKGSIDTNFDSIADYDGVLLEAEVTGFGHQDGATGADDFFDVRLGSVTGLLASLYTGRDLALRVVSEVSAEFLNPFAGTFGASFTGGAKGVVGGTDPLVAAACSIDVTASCSVDGGLPSSKCRIKVKKSAKHWEHEDYQDHHGNTCRRSTYGMHGSPEPAWTRKYPGTDVTFSYVITNTGTTTIDGITLTDSFDTPATGVPASLAPGQSATVTRVENLNESITDTVTVLGTYMTASCGDTGVVVIKDKLRERKRHDDDHYKDKGERHD